VLGLSGVIDPHEFHGQATIVAFSTAISGILLAAVFYGWGYLNPEDVRRQFSPIYNFLRGKWYFDELYEVIFIRPTHFIAARIANLDKKWIDGSSPQRVGRKPRELDDVIDRYLSTASERHAIDLSTGVALRGV
jgi:NADH-quinone oxidoreductase subunit L